MRTSEAGNKILPNTFQHPNYFVDQLMYLLTPEENVVLTFAIRRILGFQGNISSRKDNISLSQFTGEIKGKDGTILSHGCGLSVNAVRNALKTLEQYKILIPTTQTAGPNGQEYWLQENDAAIDLEGLQKRAAEKAEQNQKRVEKATEKSLKIRGIVARKGNVGRKGSVSSDDREGVTSDDNTKPSETQRNPRGAIAPNSLSDLRRVEETFKLGMRMAVAPWETNKKGWQSFPRWLLEQEQKGYPVEGFCRWFMGDEFRAKTVGMWSPDGRKTDGLYSFKAIYLQAFQGAGELNTSAAQEIAAFLDNYQPRV